MNDVASTAARAESGEGLEHGGRLAAARQNFPGASAPFLDLSTGINPVPYPVPALPPDCFARLPEPQDEAALREAAAVAYGVADPACIAAAPGTQILIDLLPRLCPARDVAVLGPTYAEHAHAWRKAGAAVRMAASLDALAGAAVAVLVNPNNPDGRRYPAADLLALAGRVGLLVVDEAFADLEGVSQGCAAAPLSLAPAMPHPRLVVLRSFGKTYGLAGLRLGFALADGATAARIRAALGPWAVSGPAIAIGRAALADRAWLAATRARLARDVAALDACLTQARLRVAGGTHLFRLAESADAPAVFDRLGRAGILVRRFAEHSHWLRFGLPGDAAAWARLRAALDV